MKKKGIVFFFKLTVIFLFYLLFDKNRNDCSYFFFECMIYNISFARLVIFFFERILEFFDQLNEF